MSADIAELWKQPCFDNLNEGVRLFHGDGKAQLHTHYAHALFYTSDALPAAASPETLKLEAARRVVAFERGHAEQALTANGFITRWTDEQCEAIAREMAERLSIHPAVIAAVLTRLDNERDEVFADRSLTHGDEMFVVRQLRLSSLPKEFSLFLNEHSNVTIKEGFIETIERALDYVSDLRSTEDHRRFIPLFRKLSSIRRVYAVVHPK